VQSSNESRRKVGGVSHRVRAQQACAALVK
jgi:hypothetical protein